MAQRVKVLRSSLIVFGLLSIVSLVFLEAKHLLELFNQYREATRTSPSIIGGDIPAPMSKLEALSWLSGQTFERLVYLLLNVCVGLLALAAAHFISPIGGKGD